jgi:hypothetical protein
VGLARTEKGDLRALLAGELADLSRASSARLDPSSGIRILMTSMRDLLGVMLRRLR